MEQTRVTSSPLGASASLATPPLDSPAPEKPGMGAPASAPMLAAPGSAAPSFGEQRLERRTLRDGVYDALCRSLMTGVYPPATRLTVRGVAEQMGTSPMPVREAFRRLTGEGALEPLANGMTQVPVLNREKLLEVTEIRYEVEGLAARRAASRITDAELAALEEMNQRMLAANRAGNLAEQVRANERFHFIIYEAARAPELLRIIERLWLQVGPFLMVFLSTSNDGLPPDGPDDFSHEDIMDALRRRDPAAAKAALVADLEIGEDFLSYCSQNTDA